MRDISTRIQRYRLSRYARHDDRLQRRMRWAWLLAGLWIVWVGFVSDHNFVRLYRLQHERTRMEGDLLRMNNEVARLDAVLDDPVQLRDMAEHVLRESLWVARPNEIIYQIQPKGHSQQK